MTLLVKFRRGTTAQNNNYTGLEGSLSVDLEKNNLRLHDGKTVGGFEIYNATQVDANISNAIKNLDLSNTLENYVLKTQLGVATSTSGEEGSEVTTVGVATLDTNGKIPTSQLPALAITSVQTVADDEAKNAIVTKGESATVQEGDVVVVTNAGNSGLSPRTYILDNAGEWIEITANNAVLSVNGYTGVVQLTKSDIGLGNVDNYATATLEQAQNVLHPTNEAFMTPQRTLDLLATIGIIIDAEGNGIADQGVIGAETEESGS
jgi:hypothetical protein